VRGRPKQPLDAFIRQKNSIKASELVVFETCAHAPIYESVSEFNEKTLSFLNHHIG
jgi:hypothetical protein